ncbi:MAG: sigma-70 family RNA polymerase sigma factor [Planctomycetota bacterium]
MDTAFQILADQHRLMLLCYARSLLHGNDHDAEDVVQETLITAHARLDQFRSGGNFGSWLRGIARNKVLESHRATRARPAIVDHRILQGVEDVYAMFDATSLGEERWLERVRRLLQGCMAKLSQPLRSAMALVYEDGASLQAAAVTLKSSRAAVGQRVSRAREMIRRCVQASLESES